MGLGELNRSGICVNTRVSRATEILSVPAVHGRYAADIDWALTRVRCVRQLPVNDRGVPFSMGTPVSKTITQENVHSLAEVSGGPRCAAWSNCWTG